MNKPAPKEPSMDEILSSIRQIIADDDAAATPRRQPFQPTVASANPAPQPAPSFDPPETEPQAEAEDEPLALSAEQIVEEPEAEAAAVPSFDEAMENAGAADEASPALIDPDDIAFESEPETTTIDEEIKAFSAIAEDDEPMTLTEPQPAMADPEPASLASAADESPVAPRRSVAETAPMPDPALSSDLAERLLEPTTDAAVRHTFSRITHMPIGNEGLTIEALMRDMLRPMLKEWLDENLPTLVERMVEKEIARVSRGLE